MFSKKNKVNSFFDILINRGLVVLISSIINLLHLNIAKKIFNDIPKKIEISYSAFADLENNTVPNVKGLNQKEAIKKLKNKGMTVKVKGKGIVKSQSIKQDLKLRINKK